MKKKMIKGEKIMYDVILNSGHIIRGVKPLDSTKNPIGLLKWSTEKPTDQILGFEGIGIRASSIAAIVDLSNDNNDLNNALNMIDKRGHNNEYN
jgi:hypothetical protein